MSKTRSIFIICAGLFLAGAGFVDSLDGSVSSASRYGGGRLIEKSLKPIAFRNTVAFNVLCGLGVAGLGFRYLRK